MASEQNDWKQQPCYMIQRPDGRKVPLIPADELPNEVILMGVNKTVDELDIDTMILTRSESLFSNGQYQLDPDCTAAKALKANVHVKKAQRFYEILPPIERSNGFSNEVVNSKSHSLPAIASTIIPAPDPPSGKEPHFSKKEYCAHWIRTGECDFQQQGCRYKHLIPLDKDKRAQLGFREYPRWMRTLNEKRREALIEKTMDNQIQEDLLVDFTPLAPFSTPQTSSVMGESSSSTVVTSPQSMQFTKVATSIKKVSERNSAFTLYGSSMKASETKKERYDGWKKYSKISGFKREAEPGSHLSVRRSRKGRGRGRYRSDSSGHLQGQSRPGIRGVSKVLDGRPNLK